MVSAACAVQRPQVLTPVRIDTVSSTASGAAASSAAPSASTTSVSAPRTAADNPVARIDRMEWPAPSTVRSAGGAPGPDYWQQRADYTIAVTLDTAQQRVSGSVTIRYT